MNSRKKDTVRLKAIENYVFNVAQSTDLTVKQSLELAELIGVKTERTLRLWLKDYRERSNVYVRFSSTGFVKAKRGESVDLDSMPRSKNASTVEYKTFRIKDELSPFPAPSKHPEALVIPVVTYRECSYCNYRTQCEAQPVGARLCEAFYLEDAKFEIDGQQLTAEQYFGTRLAELTR